jgi:lysozyme
MNISQAGLNLIKKFEGFRENAYLCPAGLPTVGYGSTYVNGVKVKIGDIITQEKAEIQLMSDCAKFEDIIKKHVKQPLTHGMFDALVSIVYNVGPGVKDVKSGIIFLKDGSHSTLLNKVNLPDKVGAGLEFLKWTRSGGKILSGLVKRRQAEKDLFLS